MQGVVAESSLRKQAWGNPKLPSLRHIHEESDWYRIYLRLLQLLVTFRVPCVPVFDVPVSPSHTSPRPILDVLKSLVSCPQVPSPHTRVPMSPSPCSRPTFIHSRLHLSFWGFTTLILLSSSTFMMLANVITEVIVLYNKALRRRRKSRNWRCFFSWVSLPFPCSDLDGNKLKHKRGMGSLHQLYERPIYMY